MIGKCPKCEKDLKGNDIEDHQFRGLRKQHFAYTCKKCGYIIGFGATCCS